MAADAYTDLPQVASYTGLEIVSLSMNSLPFIVDQDTDGDLLADSWEMYHFGTLAFDGFANSDGSLYSLAQEYLEGTDPRSSTSSPPVGPTALQFQDFQIFGDPLYQLVARWPSRYASAVNVAFETSEDLAIWDTITPLPAFEEGGGLFFRSFSIDRIGGARFRLDGREVGLDVRAGVAAAAVQVELHRLRVQRRAVVEHDARADLQHHRRRVGVGPFGHAGLGLQRVVVPLDQRVVDRPQVGVVAAGPAGGRIEARRIGVARDPQDAAAYTRAGLEVVFRPSDEKIKDGKANADTKSFFDMKKYATEEERRSDMGKWETVLHSAKNMRGSTLNNPVFDIHYNAREAGHKANGAEKIRYALIITVEAPKHADLYNEILRAYAKTLVPIQPQVSLPIRIR